MKTFSDFLLKSTEWKIDKIYDNNDSLFITITPERTRTLVKKWKLGFNKIAVDAIVPIIYGVFD